MKDNRMNERMWNIYKVTNLFVIVECMLTLKLVVYACETKLQIERQMEQKIKRFPVPFCTITLIRHYNCCTYTNMFGCKAN